MEALHEFCFWWFGEETGQCAWYLLGVGAFLLVALYWFFTGRWPIVGLLVAVAWVPVNLLFGLLWLLGLPLAMLDRMIPQLVKWVFCVLFLMGASVPGPDQETLLVLAALLAYLLFLNVPMAFFKRGAFYQPRALRYPSPRPPKPKRAFTLPGWKRKGKEKHPLPVVKVVAAAGGSVLGEQEMIRQLPRHLRELLSPAPLASPMKPQTEGEDNSPMMEEEAPS